MKRAESRGYAAYGVRSASASATSLRWLESQSTERLGPPPFVYPSPSTRQSSCLKVRTDSVKRSSPIGTGGARA